MCFSDGQPEWTHLSCKMFCMQDPTEGTLLDLCVGEEEGHWRGIGADMVLCRARFHRAVNSNLGPAAHCKSLHHPLLSTSPCLGIVRSEELQMGLRGQAMLGVCAIHCEPTAVKMDTLLHSNRETPKSETINIPAHFAGFHLYHQQTACCCCRCCRRRCCCATATAGSPYSPATTPKPNL